MGLKFFNKDTYESLGEAFKAIKQELLSLTPKDSSSVRWQRGSDGMSAVVKAVPSAADGGNDVPEESTSQPSEYNGYFTLKDVSTTIETEEGTKKEYRVAVCDGKTWHSETEKSLPSYFNVVQNGGIVFSGSMESEIITITKTCTIALRYCHGTRKLCFISYTYPPLACTGYLYYVIGDVIIEDGSMKVIQRHQGNGSGNGTINFSLGYAGDFCVYFIQPEGDGEDTFKAPTEVIVCNGNDYDPATKTSSKSNATINNVYTISIDASKFGIGTSIYAVYDVQKHLEYLRGDNDDISQVITLKNELSLFEDIAYEEIASVDAISIIQKHTSGIMRMWGVVYGCED